VSDTSTAGGFPYRLIATDLDGTLLRSDESVSQRTREMAIRLVLGAKPRELKREFVGNDAAHRVPADVRLPNSQRVEHGDRVCGHLRDRERGASVLAVSDAAVVERHARESVGQPFNLRRPSTCAKAHALNQQDGRAVSGDVTLNSSIAHLDRPGRRSHHHR